MATNASPYIVNIVPLQNVATDIRGTDATKILQTQVANLQTMIDTTTHTIYADNFSNFTPDSPYINIEANLNLASNIALYSNANLVYLNISTIAGSTTSTGVSSITASGSNTTNASGTLTVSFPTAFSTIPRVTSTYYGSSPVFITLNAVTRSNFVAFSWSNNASFANAPFNWIASV